MPSFPENFLYFDIAGCYNKTKRKKEVVFLEYLRPQIKGRARELILTAEPKPIFVGLIYLALSILVSLLSSRIMGVNMTTDKMRAFMTYYLNGDFDYAYRYFVSMSPPNSAYLVNALLNLALTIVSAGFIIFLLNTIRNTAASIGNLLDGFGMFLRIIWLTILEGILIGLWSLLFVIPGVIAAYRYRQAIYLLLDHPEMSALECIRESKRMMTGHKGELFAFDLSFIGWYLLTMIPVLGYLVQIWYVPYAKMSYALYYENLRGADIFTRSDPQDTPWEL